MLLLTSKKVAPPNKPQWPFRINPDSPQAIGLELWIPFVQGHGVVLPIQSRTSGQGIFRADAVGGYGIDFNSTDHNVATLAYPDAPFLTSQGMTVVWMGVLDQVAASMPLVIKNTNHQAANTPFNFRTGGIDAAGFAFGRGSSSANNEYTTSGGVLSANTFYVLAATVSNDLIQTAPILFWNGNTATPGAGGNTGTVSGAGQDLRIGGDFFVWNSDYFVSEVRLYNRGLPYSVLFDMYNPQTRYDLYWSPSNVAYFDLMGAGGGGGGRAARSYTFIVMP